MATDGLCLSTVALIRLHKTDPTVAVLVVDPLHELRHPAKSFIDGMKGPSGVVRPVLTAPRDFVYTVRNRDSSYYQKQGHRFCQCFDLPGQFLFEPFDLPLVLGTQPLQLLLLLEAEHWLLVGICGSVPPAHHLLRVKALLPAVGTEFCGDQTGRLQHHR